MAGSTGSTDEVLQELMALEHAGWRSLCGSTAAEFYGNLMTPDGLMILANGMVMDREQVTKALGDAPPWDGYEIRNERLVPLGNNSVALIYQGVGKREGQDDFVAWMSSVYVGVGESWELAVYTQTLVQAGG